MSIYRYGNQFFTPRCDYCGKTLPMEMSGRGAMRAMLGAGWERRAADGGTKDVCTDCLFEEKGYEDAPVEQIATSLRSCHRHTSTSQSTALGSQTSQ